MAAASSAARRPTTKGFQQNRCDLHAIVRRGTVAAGAVRRPSSRRLRSQACRQPLLSIAQDGDGPRLGRSARRSRPCGRGATSGPISSRPLREDLEALVEAVRPAPAGDETAWTRTRCRSSRILAQHVSFCSPLPVSRPRARHRRDRLLPRFVVSDFGRGPGPRGGLKKVSKPPSASNRPTSPRPGFSAARCARPLGGRQVAGHRAPAR